MITWDNFVWFAGPAAALWVCGASAAWRDGKSAMRAWVSALTVAGLCIYTAFIAIMWAGLGRPPMRTLGETRLWYSFFIIVSGLATYLRWHYRWILSFSTLMAMVFVTINLLNPETHSRSLMPALQSLWFIPHVTVYMFSYSLLACAFLLAVTGLARRTQEYLPTADTLVYVGTAFLTLGMMSGALWAKDAWGQYWSWDPKETWAAVTWGMYLLYIHLRLSRYRDTWQAYALLVAAFLCLQMCWYGVNLLPSAQGSMHVY